MAKSPRVPGEEAPAAETESPITTAEVLQGAAAAKVEGAPKTVEEILAAMQAEMVALRERNEALERSQATLLDIARANPRAVPVEPPEALPSAAEYTGKHQDKQHKMKNAVLTKEGWVVPAHLGANPSALSELQRIGLLPPT